MPPLWLGKDYLVHLRLKTVEGSCVVRPDGDACACVAPLRQATAKICAILIYLSELIGRTTRQGHLVYAALLTASVRAYLGRSDDREAPAS